MPYVVENSQLNWSDDDEPTPPKVGQFVYLPTNELGGPPGAAKLRVPTGQEESNNEEFEDPKETRALYLALKASGIARVYCRYDGGNDEGFAWVDHAELGTGERLDTAELARRLIANGLPARKRASWQRDWPDEPLVQEMLDYPLAVNWAAALLGGRGFGTGEYSMYGAFIADLLGETISDDPMANPIVRNIEIDGVERLPHRFDLIMKQYAATVPDPPASIYGIGDRVVHRTFGGGTVTEISGNMLTVTFDTGGKKRIVDSFVDRE
jgi:hypothetical protein